MRTRTFRLAALPAVLAATALALTACAGGPAPTAAASAGTPTPGGELTFAVSSDQGCADPQQVGSNDSIYSLRQIVDSLTDQDPGTGEIRPWLAESWEPNADATAWSFTLRDGVTFSDGAPLDAAAVAANFDRAQQLGVRGTLPKSYLAGYTSTTIDGPLQLTVNFSAPNVQFLQGTSTHSLGILSPASAARTDEERCTGVIGSGPFVLESYTTNDSTVLTRRAGYDWGSSLWGHTGEAYLERLTFRVVPESGVRTGSLAAGEVNAIGNIGPQDESPLTSAGAQLLARPNPGVPFGLYVQNARVTDPAVREAISLAVDRQQVVDTVFTSQTAAATSVLSQSTPLYEAQGAVSFDQAGATAVLDAAGWVPGADGIREKAGQRLSLQTFYFLNAGTNKPALELIQQQLRAVGVELVLNERPIADAQAIQESGEFDLSWGNLTRADADILRTQFASTLTNFYRLPAGPLDGLLTEQAGTSDLAARGELVAQAQEQIVDAHYFVPVVELTTVLAVGPEVQGLLYDASSRIQLFDTWLAA